LLFGSDLSNTVRLVHAEGAMIQSGIRHMTPFQNSCGAQEFPNNSALERAMVEIAKNDDVKTRELLYQAILETTFIVEGNVSGGTQTGEGKRISDENTRAAYKTIEHPRGNIILPVFTDVDALTSFAGPEAHWVALLAQGLFQSIATSGIAEVRVNPFRVGQPIRRPGGIITRNEFTALAQGLLPKPGISDNTIPLAVAAGQKVYVGKVAKLPSAELLTKLTDCFQQIPELRTAYLFQMVNQNIASTVIGLHFPDELKAQRIEQIMRSIGDFVRGEIPSGMYIDFMPLKTGAFLNNVQMYGLELLRK
jgi:hypothetical protein